MIKNAGSQLATFFVVIIASIISAEMVEHLDVLINVGIFDLRVPDAISLKTTLSSIFDGKVNVDQNYKTYAGLVYLYEFFYRNFSGNYFLTNVTLLIVASVAFVALMQSMQRGFGSLATGLIFSSFCLNPYILAVLFYPNKEIPIFMLLNISMYFLIVKGSLVFGLVSLLPIYWIRDGYFWIVSFTFVLYFLTLGSRRSLRFYLTMGVFLVLAIMPVEFLGYGDSAMKRSIETAELLRSGGVVIFTNYLTRLYYSIVSFGLFTPFLMGSKLNFLNFGYFLQGLVIVAFIAKIATRKEISKFVNDDLNFIILMQILMLSFALNIQPRYIFPLICFMTYSIFYESKKFLGFLILSLSSVSLIVN